ncbi:hypothetical protein TNCT_404231 [Trichonephila clavata]|uniref:Uncharacterized protein n=1 Tax=Trichonephila clavata TaxID=2740835 RepID=A0A8X6LU68_TRICU|nr:hypothetical protein TNCT_404231 [Trichonephila clavata]
MSLDYKACFKPVNGPPKTFQDAMDPLRNKSCPRTLIRKVLILKQAHLRSQCPDLISRGNASHPCHGPIIIQQSCVLMCPGHRGPFQDNNAVF